jgi:hypothetical protein
LFNPCFCAKRGEALYVPPQHRFIGCCPMFAESSVERFTLAE